MIVVPAELAALLAVLATAVVPLDELLALVVWPLETVDAALALARVKSVCTVCAMVPLRAFEVR